MIPLPLRRPPLCTLLLCHVLQQCTRRALHEGGVTSVQNGAVYYFRTLQFVKK